MDMEEKASEELAEAPPNEEEVPKTEFRKSKFLESYVSNYRKRTVVIEPFNPDLLAETLLQTWISQAKEFYIRKAWTSKSMALLLFESEEASEKALVELTQKLVTGGSKIQVCHPTFDDELEKCSNHLFMDQELGIDKLDEQTVFQRQIVLSGVPDSLTIDAVQRAFPQALNVLDFREDANATGYVKSKYIGESRRFKTRKSKRIVTVELASREEAETLVNSQTEVRIDGKAVSLSLFPWYAHIFGKNYKCAALHITKQESEQLKPLNDELRIDMCKAHKALHDERDRLFTRTDIFMQDKKTENSRISALMKPYEEHLIADTRRRLEAGERAMPEAADRMITPVAIIMQAEKEASFYAVPDQPSAKMKSLLDKAAQKASIKLTLLEKVRKVSDERNRRAAEAAVLPAKPNAAASEIQTIPVIGAPAVRGRGRGGFAESGRYQSAYAARASYPIPTRGGGAGSSFADWGSRVARGRGRARTNFTYKDEEPYQKRFRGGGGGGGGGGGVGRRSFGGNKTMSDSSGKSLDDMQAMLEERLRRLEEMQLQTLQVQSKMLANAAAKLNKDC